MCPSTTLDKVNKESTEKVDMLMKNIFLCNFLEIPAPGLYNNVKKDCVEAKVKYFNSKYICMNNKIILHCWICVHSHS